MILENIILENNLIFINRRDSVNILPHNPQTTERKVMKRRRPINKVIPGKGKDQRHDTSTQFMNIKH